jgi:hypothetical protein
VALSVGFCCWQYLYGITVIFALQLVYLKVLKDHWHLRVVAGLNTSHCLPCAWVAIPFFRLIEHPAQQDGK